MKRTASIQLVPAPAAKSNSRRRPKVAMTTTRKLTRMLNRSEERKYLDTSGTGVDMPTGGFIVALSSIAEGTDYSQRVGRKIRMKYLQYDFFAADAVATSTQNEGIFHLVLDRQANGASPAVGDIIDTSAGKAYNGFKNVSLYEERFKILQSFPFASTGAGGEVFRTRGYINLENLKDEDQICHYAGSASGIPNTNSLLLLYASNEAAANAVLGTFVVRFVYVDM